MFDQAAQHPLNHLDIRPGTDRQRRRRVAQAMRSDLAQPGRLGHKTATLTLDLYGRLFPDALDIVAVGRAT